MTRTVKLESKVRANAKDDAKSRMASRSPKTTLARKSKAGGQIRRDAHSASAASEVALRGASGLYPADTHNACATRKVSRTAANHMVTSIVSAPQSASPKPRANNRSISKSRSRAAPISDGQNLGGHHPDPAVAPTIPDVVTIMTSEAAEITSPRQEPQSSLPIPSSQIDAITAINETWRMRQGLVKAMTKLSLQAQASIREGRSKEDAASLYREVSKNESHPQYGIIAPYLGAMEPLAFFRGEYEKQLIRAVKTLPIYTWAKGVSGLGEPSLAGIIGECSGLNVETNEWWTVGQMKSVSAMWKRLGLAVMGGVRQGDATAGLTKADWVEHGYVKTRRSVIWNVGECVVKAQWRKENTVHAYGKFYGEEKARLQALNESGEYAEQAVRIVERMKKAGSKPLAENLAGRLTPGHINNRAKRHMTKRLIRDLWIEWRRLDREALGYAPMAEAA